MARVKLKRFKVTEPTPAAQAKYMREYSGREVHDHAENMAPITSQTMFGVDAPLVLDLGCGRVV